MALSHIDKIRPKVLSGSLSDEYRWPLNGGELQDNWNMSDGASGWVSTGVTVQAVTEDGEIAVLITSLDGSSDRGELPISGLTIGREYRCVVRAKKGVGESQSIRLFTWGTVSATNVDSDIFVNYEFNVTATATSGNTRVFSSVAENAGDTVYVSSISIREI